MAVMLLFQQLDSGTMMVRVTNGSYVESCIASTSRVEHIDGTRGTLFYWVDYITDAAVQYK